jgi:tetratricopeptide (TPR) repeat protein
LGGYSPIIRQVGTTDYGTLLITDPSGGASWFFANRQHPGYNDQYSFYQPKSPSTMRVFLVGESAMKGFPQPRQLAASSFFREMLQDVWPDRKIEVINLGTTAVASFPVLGILREALQYEPDLVIVSTGHNEFFGTYGVASSGWVGGKPWLSRLTRFAHSLAIVQSVDKALRARNTRDNKSLMEIMVGQGYVAPDDWRRRTAAGNLEHNIGAMVRLCKTRGIAVVICTQPSNERDLAPIGADKLDRHDKARRNDFNRSYTAGIHALAETPEVALQHLRDALAIDETSAAAHFHAGKACFALGRHAEARTHFIRARDLDSMPWRTPSLSQQAIIRAASQHGAFICDLEKAFRDASPGGAIGWELMDDHVHPTLLGQWLVALSWVEALTHLDGKIHVSTETYAALPDATEYARRLGDNPFDRYGVAHMMRVVFSIPFMRQNNPQAYARFNKLATELEFMYSRDIQAVMREYQTSTPHAGGKRPITGMVARALLRERQYKEALELLEIAQRAVPDYTSWHMEYVYFALVCKEKINGSLSDADKAQALEEIEQGRFLLQHGYSEYGLAERYLGRLHQLRGEFEEAIPFLLASRKKLTGTDLVAADQALVVSYLKTGRPADARQIVDNGIAHSGQFARFYIKMREELTTMEQANRAVPATIPDP